MKKMLFLIFFVCMTLSKFASAEGYICPLSYNDPTSGEPLTWQETLFYPYTPGRSNLGQEVCVYMNGNVGSGIDSYITIGVTLSAPSNFNPVPSTNGNRMAYYCMANDPRNCW